MKALKKLLEIMALAAVLFFAAYTGYRQNVNKSDDRELSSVDQDAITEQKKAEQAAEQAKSSFLFRIDTLYSRGNTADADWMDNAEKITGGHIQTGKLKPGDKAVLVKSDGTCYMTTVERITRHGARLGYHCFTFRLISRR